MTRSTTDGRTARAERTREAVIAALEAMISEGQVGPSAAQIAARAGISTRSIYVHFASLEDLFGALAQRTRTRTLELLRPIDPEAPLEERIAEICRQRARVNEEIGPIRRAAARQEARSPTLAAARASGRTASRDQVRRVFAPELGGLDSRSRRKRVAAVDALLSGESWDLLRTVHDLSPTEARMAVADALRSLLPPAVGAPSE